MTLSESFPEAAVAAFSVNRNFQHAKLEWRYNEVFRDPRWAIAYIGAAQLEQAKRAEKRYRNAALVRASLDEQTRQSADHARVLKATIEESSDAVRREVSNVVGAVQKNTDALTGLASQVSQLAWLQAEQNAAIHRVLETIRESRANECRQLVEQGERNFSADFLAEAEERFRLALTYDNTDYPTHQNLGLTLVRLGRMDEALEHFKKALAFPPNADSKAASFFVARAATHAARVLYAKEDYAGAESHLRRALDADGRNAKNWYDLAVMRAYQRDTAGAIEALRGAFSLDATLAGAALADDELAPIRSAVERLVIDETARAMTTLEEQAEALRSVVNRVTEIARAAGIDVPVPPVDEIARTARTRGTLPAAMEAGVLITRARQELVTGAIEHARGARFNLGQETTESVRRIQNDRETRRQAAQRDIDVRRGEASKQGNLLAQFGLGFLGLIVGAIIGGKVGGFGGVVLGGGIGSFVGAMGYAIVFHLTRRAARAEIDEHSRASTCDSENADAEVTRVRDVAGVRTKQLDGYLVELQQLRA